MAGTVLKVNAKVGDKVESGQVVVILEAMKMETPISASGSGTVTSVEVAAGTAVQEGQVLVKIG
jgi:biotin carboxyl carrier protein